MGTSTGETNVLSNTQREFVCAGHTFHSSVGIKVQSTPKHCPLSKKCKQKSRGGTSKERCRAIVQAHHVAI